MSIFKPTNVLLPQVEEMEKWAVIACDQFTSQPEYWERVRKYVGNKPSAYNLILPEVNLSGENGDVANKINDTMRMYLDNGVFKEYSNSYIYVERILKNGLVRKGIVGVIDLEDYDYSADAASRIRATEKTVVDRIPPRKEIRKNALIELPHVLLLCDDEEKNLIETVSALKEQLPKLYEFELMEEGGRIKGWLVKGEMAEHFDRQLQGYEHNMTKKYGTTKEQSLLFVVGDGNHSLATAKACYEEKKRAGLIEDINTCLERFAMVELENIHDETQQFEPIHRVIKNTKPEKLLEQMKMQICASDGFPIEWYIGGERGVLYLDKSKGKMPVEILQEYLDSYLEENIGEIDYIHGDETLRQLANVQKTIGFMLPSIEKCNLFNEIMNNGVLPRKTFSMGHACEKRYYIEARKICEKRESKEIRYY